MSLKLCFSKDLKTSLRLQKVAIFHPLQGRPSQNGYFEFDLWNTSTPISLAYLASNQQLQEGIL